jgi:hypothetical protein
MRKQSKSKVRLEPTEAAPSNAIELLQRLAVREPEINTKAAKAILEAAGVNASPNTASMALSETRKLIRYLKAKKLLSDDFHERRTQINDDFIERKDAIKPRQNPADRRTPRSKSNQQISVASFANIPGRHQNSPRTPGLICRHWALCCCF